MIIFYLAPLVASSKIFSLKELNHSKKKKSYPGCINLTRMDFDIVCGIS